MMMIYCYVVNLYKQSNTTMIMTSNLGDCDSHRQHDHRSLHVRLWSRQVKPNYIEILPTSKEKMHLKKYASLTLLTILKFTTNILTFSPSPSWWIYCSVTSTTDQESARAMGDLTIGLSQKSLTLCAEADPLFHVSFFLFFLVMIKKCVEHFP